MTTALVRKGGVWVRPGYTEVDPEPGFDYVVDGGDIATTIAAAPTDAVILVRPKADSAPYRITAALAPKAGQTILGQRLSNGDTTVIDGSADLSGLTWTNSSGSIYWCSTTLPDYTESTAVQCELTTGPNAGNCRKREQIWIDGVHLTRVMALSELTGPDEFYEDYAADRVYIGLNPAGHEVLMSKTNYAFNTSAANVKLYNLTIQRFASPSQQGAVFIRGAGSEVAHNTIRWNHAIGVFTDLAPGVRVYSNEIYQNGQLGIGCHECHGAIIELNELWGNNTDGYRPDDWESGDIKVTWSKGAIVRDNYCHDSRGLAIWYDIENGEPGRPSLIQRNRVERAYADGIRYEISYDAIIEDNQVDHCGFQYAADHGLEPSFTGYSGFGTAGINVNTSRNVTVRRNTLGPNQNGIFAQFRPRATTEFPNRDLINFLAERNDVTMVPVTLTGKNGNIYTSGLLSGEGVSGLHTLMGSSGIPTPQYYDSTKNNRFRNNTFRVSAPGRQQYAWNQGYRSWDTARSAGFESGADSPDSVQLPAPRAGWQITAGNRDGNFHNTGIGMWSATGTKIFFGDNNADPNDQHRGGHFLHAPAIPAGTTITAAALHFYATGQSGIIPRLLIRAEKTTAALVPTSKANMQAKLANLTTASVAWRPAVWPQNSWQATPDLAAILQELTALPGWTTDSPVQWVIETHPDQEGITAGQISCNAYETDPALTCNLQASWS